MDEKRRFPCFPLPLVRGKPEVSGLEVHYLMTFHSHCMENLGRWPTIPDALLYTGFAPAQLPAPLRPCPRRGRRAEVTQGPSSSLRSGSVAQRV